MRVTVDTDRCDSNGICTSIAPEVFRLDDDDNLQILVEQLPAATVASAEEAARACPKFAITLVDEQ